MRSRHLQRMYWSGRFRQRRPRTTRTLALLTVLTLSTLGVVFNGSTASAATHTAAQKNLQFNPSSLTIAVGDTVTWTNDETDGTTHSVVQSGGGAINSPDMPPGSTFSHRFTDAGTVNITCRFHPDMFMSVNVGGSTPPPTSTTTNGPSSGSRSPTSATWAASHGPSPAS